MGQMNFTSCLVFLCLFLTIIALTLSLDDEEGTVDSDNPNIDGEDEQIVDSDMMFNEDLLHYGDMA